MPELTWIGKEKVITHHLDVPFRVLDRKYSFDEAGRHVEDNGSENMIIHGDNLEALKALLPRFEGKIDCIYIDPPYNTGNEGWVYNDNVNDPRIKKWLGEVVGKEGDDLSRHDKWLCMMYPRLRLLQRLLSKTGVAVFSISHHELASLLLILREIFSTYNITPVTVQTSGGKPSNGFNITNEYLIFVTLDDFSPNVFDQGKKSYSSAYHGMNLATFNQVQRPNQAYPIYVDEGGKIVGVGPSLAERIADGTFTGEPEEFTFDWSPREDGAIPVWPVTSKGVPCVWRLIPERLVTDWMSGFIKVSPSKDKTQNLWSIQYLSEGIKGKIRSGEFETFRISDDPQVPTVEVLNYETSSATVPQLWVEKEYFTSRGGDDISAIFGQKSAFSYPKPVALIRDLLARITAPDAVVLDSFAGSGTTGNAVLELNRLDGGSRSFILVELGDYAESVTAERVSRVIRGYGTGRDFREGLGGSYSYYELGEPLLREGLINEAVGIDRVREYIWFNETRSRFTREPSDNPYFLGIHQRTSYHLLYEPDQPMTLNRVYLAALPAEQRSDSLVIYADTCSLSAADMVAARVTFKKIPRDISRL